jgi:multidrug resistance efflux pump
MPRDMTGRLSSHAWVNENTTMAKTNAVQAQLDRADAALEAAEERAERQAARDARRRAALVERHPGLREGAH